MNPTGEPAKTTERETGSPIVDIALATLQPQFAADEWADVDAFLRRRDFATWAAWLREFTAFVTGGGALPTDIARVCRDEGMLSRPLGSPLAVRAFITKAIAERRAASAEPGPSTRRRGGVAQRTFENGVRALSHIPDAVPEEVS